MLRTDLERRPSWSSSSPSRTDAPTLTSRSVKSPSPDLLPCLRTEDRAVWRRAPSEGAQLRAQLRVDGTRTGAGAMRIAPVPATTALIFSIYAESVYCSQGEFATGGGAPGAKRFPAWWGCCGRSAVPTENFAPEKVESLSVPNCLIFRIALS